MENVIDSLNKYLLFFIRSLFLPSEYVEFLNSQKNKLTIAIYTSLISSIAGLSLMSTTFGSDFSMQFSYAWIILPITFIYLIIQISWASVKVKVDLELAFSIALLYFGLLCVIYGVFFAFGMSAIRIIQPNFYVWIYNNSWSNFAHFLLDDASKNHPYTQGKGFVVLIFTTLFSAVVFFIYWIKYWILIGKVLDVRLFRIIISLTLSLFLLVTFNAGLNLLFSF